MTTAKAAAKRPRNRARSGSAANAARGEHSLTLGNKAYRLRPSYQASDAIEMETEQSLVELFRKANMCRLSFAEMGIIASEYIRAGANEDDAMTRAISADRVSELIYEAGVSTVLATITVILGDAITGGRTTTGEPKAVPATMETTGTAA